MAVKVKKDPDNTWYTWLDWSEWFDAQISDIGGIFTVTASVWFPETVMTETGTKLDDSTKKMYFYGHGGIDGVTYNLLNRISYTSSTLGAQVFTEDRTMQIHIVEK